MNRLFTVFARKTGAIRARLPALLAALAVAALLAVPAGAGASPLTDFSRGALAVEASYNLHTFDGLNNSYGYGVTAGLGNGWAVNYRLAGYDPVYFSRNYTAVNREFNIIRKIDDSWQLYGGYSATTGSGNGAHLRKNVVQAGVIGTKKLNKQTTFFVNMGGGWNVANVEFGLSYQLQPGLEVSAIYRHLSVEKIKDVDDKLNLRSISLGLTWKR